MKEAGVSTLRLPVHDIQKHIEIFQIMLTSKLGKAYSVFVTSKLGKKRGINYGKRRNLSKSTKGK